jgi:transketolase
MALSTTALQTLSWQLRLDILNMVFKNDGHFGGPLSCLDLLVSVYFSSIFNFSNKSPSIKDDNFILSAGHLAPALYVVLAKKGYFPSKLLDTFSQFGSILQGHTSSSVPGVSYSSGALGQGLSFASGLALANQLEKRKKTTICLTTDGEHQEGQTWEAVMFASKYKLNKLINIVDRNMYQIDGSTESIMPLEDLASKYIRFGWTVKEVDGHDYKKIQKIFELSKSSDYPTCIIAHTTFAKGIPFAHYDYTYHDVKNLDKNLYKLAKHEIEKHLN